MENKNYRASEREDFIFKETVDYFKEQGVASIDMLPLLHFRLESGHQGLTLKESITIFNM